MAINPGSRPRILVSSSIFPNKVEPTKGIYIFHQARALSAHCPVKVVAPVPYFPGWLKSQTYSFYSRIAATEVLDSLEVSHPRVLIIPKVGRSTYGFAYFFSLLRVVKRFRSRFNPDVLLCFWVYPDGFANVLLAKSLGIPIILGGRGCDVNNADEYRSKKFMVSWALRNSDKVLAVSQAMKKQMMCLGVPDGKIRVVPNGLDDRFIGAGVRHAAARDNHGGNGRKRILYCGRLSPEKGLEYLIEAAGILHERDASFELLLVGKGPQEIQIKNLIKGIGIGAKVTMIKEMPHSEIPGLMGSVDIFCLPSIREGWPNVLMEALACGVPVVATEVGGVPEILRSEDCGLMVPKQNPVRLADALESAMERTWDTEKIRASAIGRGWEMVAQEILSEVGLVLR